MKCGPLAIAVIVGCSSFCVAAGTNDGVASSDYSSEREFLERYIEFRTAAVRSDEALEKYLASTDQSASVFRVLSPSARKRFLQSLRFGEKGLASFDYRDLRRELTPSQIYTLLSVFGAQRSTASIPGLEVITAADEVIVALGRGPRPPSGDQQYADYLDMYCDSRATCRPSTGAICIGDNC